VPFAAVRKLGVRVAAEGDELMQLCEREFNAVDRGLPTKATDSNVPLVPHDGEIYLVLDCAPETSQARLAARGASLTEEFHTLPSLTDYRIRFQRVCAELKGHLIDAEGTADEVLTRVLNILRNQSEEP